MNKLVYTFCLVACLFLGFTQGRAEVLEFKEGQKASFSVDQVSQQYIEGVFYGSGDSKALVEFDARVLKGESYPYELELTFTRIKLEEKFAGVFARNQEVEIFYDSTASDAERTPFAAKMDELIGKPLHYIVYEDRIEETTKVLEDLENSLEGLDEESTNGVTVASAEAIVAQLFHCAGCDLLVGNTYSLNHEQLFGKEEELDDEDEDVILSKEKAGLYVVEQANSQISVAKWSANYLMETANGSSEKCEISGDVVWNMNNPLIQQREAVEDFSYYSADMDAIFKGKFQQKFSSK